MSRDIEAQMSGKAATPIVGISDPIQRCPVGEGTVYPGPEFMCFSFLLVSDVGYYNTEFHLNI